MGFFALERRAMDYLYLVDSQEQLAAYQAFVAKYDKTIVDYIQFLSETYAVRDLPQAVLWATAHAASHIIRECPIPAYTNAVRLVLTPDRQVWRDLYLKQLDCYEPSELLDHLRQHYEQVSDNHVLQVLGHEFAHWSDRFAEDKDFYRYIWFEEGVVEYISRRYFLTPEEFAAEKWANQQLVNLFEQHYGWHSLNDFGQATYEGDYASIFYEYWRSFLLVDQLIDQLGSVEVIFAYCHEWLETEPVQTFLDWLIKKGVLPQEP